MKIKVMVVSNGELVEKEIDNTLGTFQDIVGGYIEMPLLSKTLKQHNIDIVINDEGKFIEGLKPEIAIVGKGTNAVLDVVYGNCIFVGHDNVGNTTGLTNEQIQIIMKELEVSAMLNDKGKDFLVKVLLV